MGFLYRTATLAPDVLTSYEESPDEINQWRGAGMGRVHTRSWRHKQAAASIRILTISHPRLVKLGLHDTIMKEVQDLVWSQRFHVDEQNRISMSVNGADATGVIIKATINPGNNTPLDPIGIIPWTLFGRHLNLIVLTWGTRCGLFGTRCYNDHAYVAVSDDDHWDEVSKGLPQAITYK